MTFKVNDTVNVTDLDKDSGIIVLDKNKSVLVKNLTGPGTVVEVREHPPHVEHPGEDPNPSPHCLVRLQGPDTLDHDVWFAAARLSAA